MLLLLSHFSHIWSVQPHRRQPIRLPRPWGSPGKNTGVGKILNEILANGIPQNIRMIVHHVAAAKSLQSCPTLRPIDGSPPGSPIPGILPARTLEWAAISFSNVWKWKVKVKSFSHVWLLTTPWAAAYQAPLYKGFSRQEYWSGVPLPSPYTSWPSGIYPRCARLIQHLKIN